MEITATVGDVKDCVRAYEEAMFRSDVHKEDAAAAIDALKANGIPPAAAKLAVRLKKQAQDKPHKVRAFLKGLDHMVQSLDLDAQLDLEDAIRDGAAGAERLAGALVANAVRVVRDDPDLARKFANTSLTDSEGNGFSVDSDGVVTAIERPVEHLGPDEGEPDENPYVTVAGVPAEEEPRTVDPDENLDALERRLKKDRDSFKPRARGRKRSHDAYGRALT
jgi:hypothetical protein